MEVVCSSSSKCHYVVFRLPRWSEFTSRLITGFKEYAWPVIALFSLFAVYWLISRFFFSEIQNGLKYGVLWIFLGYTSILVSVVLVALFSGSKNEGIFLVGLSMVLILIVAFCVHVAINPYGNRPELDHSNSVANYWNDIAQNALLVLGGGLAGNLLLDGARKFKLTWRRKWGIGAPRTE